MGFKLRREVRDNLPPGLLTANERCVLLELADYCNDETRSGKPGAEWLAKAADVPVSKVGEIVARIGKKWTELRVPLGVGKDGRPFYSKTGVRTEYRFPVLSHGDQVPQNGVPEATQNGVPEVPGNGVPEVPQNGVPGAPNRSPKTGGPSPISPPQRDTSSLSRESAKPTKQPALAHRVLTEAGATPDEADRLIPVIEQEHNVRSPAGWWRTVANAGDGPAVLAIGRRVAAGTGRPSGGDHEPYRNSPCDEYEQWAAGPHNPQESAA